MLYAFTSTGNNNGSAFAGLAANTPFYNRGSACDVDRALLADDSDAGNCRVARRKKKVPASAGTLPTHTPLFIGWLIGVVMIVGALNFIPALALGPIVEHLMLYTEQIGHVYSKQCPNLSEMQTTAHRW